MQSPFSVAFYKDTRRVTSAALHHDVPNSETWDNYHISVSVLPRCAYLDSSASCATVNKMFMTTQCRDKMCRRTFIQHR